MLNKFIEFIQDKLLTLECLLDSFDIILIVYLFIMFFLILITHYA